MTYEEQRVVTSDPVTEPVATERVVESAPVAERATVVERRPTTRIIQSDDPIGNAYAASHMIQTIVWSVVVIVLLVVLLLALHTYAHLF